MHKYIIISVSLFALYSCNYKANHKYMSAGPLPACPYGVESSIIKKLNSENKDKLFSCYDYSLKFLLHNNLLQGKITWMQSTQSEYDTEEFIINALEELGSIQVLHQNLGDIYIKQENWTAALQQLNLANIPVNHPKRLLVETQLDEYSIGTNLNLLPYIYIGTPLGKAKVYKNQSNGFEIQKISNGDATKINGEPSITSSPDGQNIWLTWTDSGQSAPVNDTNLNFWTIQSSQSRDGGDTWSNVSMNTLPGQLDRFHFDPMTLYDEANNIIYAGGMVKGFGPPPLWGETPDDAMFFYRWELDNDTNFGPFKTFIPQPDKGWMATDSDGNITLAHWKGIDYSTDKAESFTSIATQYFLAAHPRILPNGCLFITDADRVITCDGSTEVNMEHTFSSASPFFVADDLPGTFRMFNFAQNAIHPNGDIYVTYHEYKSLNSNDLNIQMVKSSDNGLTWSPPWVISTETNRDQFAPWIEIDKNGGMHVIFFDTRNGTEPDNSEDATLDVYYQYSDDFGQSWTETRVTPTSFTLPELIWGDYFFSDYISLSISDDTVYLAFPWSEQEGEMHMYFAKKSIQKTDIIYINGFE